MPIPSQRFDLASWYDPDENKPGKSQANKAALIDGYGDFLFYFVLCCLGFFGGGVPLLSCFLFSRMKYKRTYEEMCLFLLYIESYLVLFYFYFKNI